MEYLNSTGKDNKPINRSIDDMDKFEEKEITKKNSFAKNTWYDCYNSLINFFHEPITVGGIKNKVISLFETNTTKRVKNVYDEEIFLNWKKKMKQSKTE